ncbi:MAG: spore coat protein [Alphaproteobacteria bacterium]
MSERAIAVIQARMTSTRLPRKVMLPLEGATVVARVIERAQRIPGIDGVCLAIPDGAAHAELATIARAAGAAVAVGSETDVLGRYLAAAAETRADIVVRVTSDCPLIDPGVSGAVLALLRNSVADYTRTSIATGYPLGLDTEAIRTHVLATAAAESQDPYEREHVTPFIWRRPERFPYLLLDRIPNRRAWRLTLDTAPDYELIRRIYAALQPTDARFDFAAIERLLLVHPDWLAINADVGHTPIVGWPKG